MRTIPALLAAATILVAAARPASAQSHCASPGDVVRTCAKAGAEATALAVADSRMERDTLVLDDLYTVVDAWRDAEIMGAALAVAQDPGAAVPARVYAMRHLLGLVRANAAYSYGRLVAGPRMITAASGEKAAMPGCARGMSSEIANRVGTPLPADYKEQIRSALGEIASKTSNPTAVRNAASCVE